MRRLARSRLLTVTFRILVAIGLISEPCPTGPAVVVRDGG